MGLRRKFRNFKAKYFKETETLEQRFQREVNRWFADKGDETLRLDYPLTAESIVVDLGGYHGDFADSIYSRYGSEIFVFEPMPGFFSMCEERFRNNPKIHCYMYGLSDKPGFFQISEDEDASSISRDTQGKNCVNVEVRSVVDEYAALLQGRKIDLLKINIEGGEFEVLPALIESGLIRQVKNIQVQFHTFIDDAEKKRAAIRKALKKTHVESWSYEFVWENWVLK